MRTQAILFPDGPVHFVSHSCEFVFIRGPLRFFEGVHLRLILNRTAPIRLTPAVTQADEGLWTSTAT